MKTDTVLRAVLGWLFGLPLVVIGTARIISSLSLVPGAQAVDATVDSETRAAGPLLIAYGAAFLWAMRRDPPPVTSIRMLGAVTGLMGLSRVVSMAAAGAPHWLFIYATVIEFVCAGLAFWYAGRAEQRSRPTGRAAAQPDRT